MIGVYAPGVLTLQDLSEPPLDGEVPLLDQGGVHVPVGLEEWVADGVLHLPGLIPGAVIDAYCQRFLDDAHDRAKPNTPSRNDAEAALGYGIGTPYLTNSALRDVCLDHGLMRWLNAINDEPMGLHLNLTGWKSTQRAWHQDRYLNPPYVGNFYAAAWIALADISSDAGPFEYVPGSHKWPSITRAKMLEAMGEGPEGDDPDWPWRSESILGPLFDREIIERGAEVVPFLASKGDVLLWHPNLAHRGSVPNDPNLLRPTVIAHYSVISRRLDMPHHRRWNSATADGDYFVLGPVS